MKPLDISAYSIENNVIFSGEDLLRRDIEHRDLDINEERRYNVGVRRQSLLRTISTRA